MSATTIQLATSRAGIGLDIPHNLPFVDFRRMAERATKARSRSTWEIADLAAHADGHHGERYEALAEITGLADKTLRNYATVARAFEMSRRRDKLAFGHHAELANLEPAEQDRLLDESERLRWSQRALRDHRAVAAAAANRERWNNPTDVTRPIVIKREPEPEPDQPATRLRLNVEQITIPINIPEYLRGEASQDATEKPDDVDRVIAFMERLGVTIEEMIDRLAERKPGAP